MGNKKPNTDGLIPYKPGHDPRREGHGRPRGSLNRSTIALKWLRLAMTCDNMLSGVEETLDVEDRMTLALMIKAIKEADTQAYNAIMNSAYGTPKQTIETSTVTKKLTVNIGKHDGPSRD